MSEQPTFIKDESMKAEGGDVEDMKMRVKQMEEDAAKLKELQSKLVANTSGVTTEAEAERAELDARSIYVGNVDFSSTPEELQNHFQACGTIQRVTILSDKWTGRPKGFAYIEFADKSSVTNAMVLNESLFRGRLLQVTAKRTNVPGYRRGGRGRGRGRRPYRGRYRGRGRGFSPY